MHVRARREYAKVQPSNPSSVPAQRTADKLRALTLRSLPRSRLRASLIRLFGVPDATGPRVSGRCAWRSGRACAGRSPPGRRRRRRGWASRGVRGPCANRSGARPSNRREEEPRGRASRACPVNRTRSGEGDVQVLAPGLVVLELVGDDAKGQGLHMSDGFLLGRTVGERAGQFDHLGDPATILFTLDLNAEHDRHDSPPLLHHRKDAASLREWKTLGLLRPAHRA